MATPIFDQRPAYYLGKFYRGTRIVQNVQLAGFAAGAVLKVTLFTIADATGGISESALDSSYVTVSTVDATHRQVVIEAANSAKLTNTFGYFAEYTVDGAIVGIATFTFGRFIPGDSTAITGDDTIVLSAGTGNVLALTNPAAPVDYVLSSADITAAYAGQPIAHSLNTLYCKVTAWTAAGVERRDVQLAPWTDDPSTRSAVNWSELLIPPVTNDADKVSRVVITRQSPLL